jgi:hypothetical protein
MFMSRNHRNSRLYSIVGAKTNKSEAAKQMDALQAALRPTLQRWGYRGRGRTFNRTTQGGLTQVITFQMGSFDPPGTTYIPGLRENMYGRFTVNLGVYVPEVARHHGGGEAKSIVQEYHCCVRARIGTLGTERADLWWDLAPGASLVSEIQRRLEGDALPFLERFKSRDSILQELMGQATSEFAIPPRIVCAIILVERQRLDDARRLLAVQARETRNPGHPAYVRGLAEKLGLGGLDA